MRIRGDSGFVIMPMDGTNEDDFGEKIGESLSEKQKAP
jgi:hypothetical protein